MKWLKLEAFEVLYGGNCGVLPLQPELLEHME